MNRTIVYIGSIPQDVDLLNTNKHMMIGSGWIAQSVIGTGTLFYGLGCTPTSPATLTVNIAPGCVFSQQNIDNSAYGSIASDTTHQIVKVGLNIGTLNFSCPAPVTAGQSVVYLIEGAFVESDAGSTVLPYYNAANPATPWAGPNNTGVSQNTIRQNLCTLQVKVGVPATTGTQVTPAPDVGFTALWAVTVANGQATVTSGNIAEVGGAPFITESLTQKISQTTADARYAQISAVQTDALDFALDTSGSANTLVAALNPAVTTLTQGMTVVVTVANNNNGASTLNLNGLGAKNITNRGNALVGGELAAGQNASLSYNGSVWNLMSNPANLAQLYTGGTSTGSANAQVVTPVTPAGFALLFGNIVTFTAGFSNSAATTINVSGTGVITIKKKSGGGGLVDLVSGDIVATDAYQIIYDGVFWELYSLSFPPSSTFFQVANNLSEGVAGTMRSNLGMPSNTAALLTEAQVFQVSNNFSEVANQATAQTNLGVRIRLTGNTTYHVSSTGNDSNPGTSGSPWLTLQHARDYIANSIDLAGFMATVSVADGTYTGGMRAAGPFTGNGSVQFTGNTTTPSNCLISTTATDCFYAASGAVVFIQGFKLQTTTSGNGLLANAGGNIFVNGPMVYGACAGNHIEANGPGALVLETANSTISGGALSHWAATTGASSINCTGNTKTLTGTPAFSAAFAFANLVSLLTVASNTFSGAATGQRYESDTNGVINTNGGGSTYLPGSVSGNAITGLYI